MKTISHHNMLITNCGTTSDSAIDYIFKPSKPILGLTDKKAIDKNGKDIDFLTRMKELQLILNCRKKL